VRALGWRILSILLRPFRGVFKGGVQGDDDQG
jgi:hypothetical protein